MTVLYVGENLVGEGEVGGAYTPITGVAYLTLNADYWQVSGVGQRLRGFRSLGWIEQLNQTPALTFGALAGSASLSMTGSAELLGAGALAGTAPISLASTSTLDGLGELVGAESIAIAADATLDGIGELVGSADTVLDADGTLDQPETGDGAIDGSSELSFAADATIDATGELAGTAVLSFGGSAPGDESTEQPETPSTAAGWSSIRVSVGQERPRRIIDYANIRGECHLTFSARGVLQGFDDDEEFMMLMSEAA